jgi:hypothetical protein
VELVMQGVRGIRELARLRFQNGFNIVIAGNESGKTTAVDILQRLLFPSTQAGNSETLVSKYTPDASRSALVVCSDDGLYYRVIQDFVKSAVNLSKYNPASKEFNLLHKDWESMAKFMRGLTADLSEEDYGNVFVLRREHFHDRLLSGAQAPAATSRRLSPNPAPVVTPKDSAAPTRLDELRETLRKAEEAADADYRYQSAKLAHEEVNKKLAALNEIEKKNAEIESSLAELKACENLPQNLNEVLEDHERHQGQKRADAEDLRREIEGLDMRLSSIPMSHLATNKLFLLGAALGLLSLVIGLYVLTDAYAYVFQIGIIFSLILMATAWYNSSRKNAQFKALKREAENARSELTELEREAVHDGAIVAAHMRSIGAATTGELKEKAESYRHLRSLLQEQEEARHRILGNETPEALRQQYQKQQEEVLRLEAAARAVAHHAVDTYSIRQDIERLESELSSSGMVWADINRDVDMPTEFIAATPGSWGWLAELAVASRIGGIEMDTLFPAVEAVAQKNLSAVTGGRYVRIELGHEGSIVVHAKDGSAIKFDDLSHGTKALVYFCFRAGLVEALVGKLRLAFILDDALAGFDLARQQAACQILRSLGAKTQVLFFTSNASLKAANDVVAELK